MMNDIKVVKIDPLDMPSDIALKAIVGLQLPLREFVIWIDDATNTLYLNSNIKFPKKDIQKMIEIVSSDYRYVCDPDEDGGYESFLDHLYNTYGGKSSLVICEAHGRRWQKQEEIRAKQEAEEIAPLIAELLDGCSVNDMLTDAIMKKGEDAKSCGYREAYAVALGYLAGAGRIDTEKVIRFFDATEEE